MENEILQARDPVCGMTPNPDAAIAKGNDAHHKGVHYVFCCAGCKTKFEADPEKYLLKSAAPAPAPVALASGNEANGDAPACKSCGAIMTSAGSGYRCENCGSTSDDLQ